MAHQGYGLPEVEASLHPGARAVPAGRRNPPALPVLLGTVAILCYARESYRLPGSWASSSLRLAQNVQDPALLWAHMMHWEKSCSGWESLFMPEDILEQGIALYDPQQHRSHTFLYGNDTGVGCLFYAGLGAEVLLAIRTKP